MTPFLYGVFLHLIDLNSCPLYRLYHRCCKLHSMEFCYQVQIVYYGVFGTVGAYLLWYRGLSRVPASVAGVFTGVLPVSAVLLSYAVLREPFLWSHLIGMTCVLLAIVLIAGSSSGEARKEAG